MDRNENREDVWFTGQYDEEQIPASPRLRTGQARGPQASGSGNPQNSRAASASGFRQDADPTRAEQGARWSGSPASGGFRQDAAPQRTYVDYSTFFDDFQAAYDQSVPERIRRMREMQNFGDYISARRSTFLQQARLMADYTDDQPYDGCFRRYFPTYQDMTTAQLRGYFTWRTRMRAVFPGNVPPDFLRQTLEKTPSYLSIWLYEIINGIGVSSPEDGLQKLTAAARLFRTEGLNTLPGLSPDTRDEAEKLYDRILRWARDYAVCHDIPPEQAGDLFPKHAENPLDVLTEFDSRCISDIPAGCGAGSPQTARGRLPEAAAAFVLQPENAARIFSALCQVSQPDPSKSALMKKDPVTLQTASAWVYASLCRYLWMEKRTTLISLHFGNRGWVPYRLFESAIFIDSHPKKEYQYNAGNGEIYLCRGGSWYTQDYPLADTKSEGLGNVCRETDRLLRERLKLGRPIAAKRLTALESALIPMAVDAYLAAREKAKQPKVRIDLSRLDAIRKDAAVTRDRLIVEDPAEEMSPQADISSKPAAAISMPAGRPQDPEDSKPSAGAVSALTPQQRQFLTLLLQGADAVGYARANHLMLSALTDSINEAFYDEIGDSILEMDGEAPELIEDYRDDVKELLS